MKLHKWTCSSQQRDMRIFNSEIFVTINQNGIWIDILPAAASR